MGVYVFRDDDDDDDDDDRKTRCCEKREKNLCVEDWSSLPSKDLCPIRGLIENDDAGEFDSFLRKSKITYRLDDVLLKYAGFEMCPYGILGKICHHRATKCATLLLSRRRKLGSLMNLNILNCYGSYPLHDAAISLSASLVKLLIDRGASLDARSLDGACISPLEYAVESLSCDRDLIRWSPKKSVFKLIITLCLPRMKEALETIELLAGVSSASTVIRDTIFSAVKREQVVAVAVLLLLAPDRVMESFYRGNMASSGPHLLFPEAIMNELTTLINQESALMGYKEHAKILQLCREKKELMIYFLQMIEIFNRAGPDLKSYLETRTSDVTNEKVSNHVAELLKKAGFILSTDDPNISNITSPLETYPVPLDTTVKQQEYDEVDDPEGIFFKPCRQQLCRCNMKIPSCATSNVFQRIVGTSFLYNHRRGFSSCAGPSIHQPLRMIPRRDINADEFIVNTVAPQYLNNSLFYVEPSKFQPPGVFNSLVMVEKIRLRSDINSVSASLKDLCFGQFGISKVKIDREKVKWNREPRPFVQLGCAGIYGALGTTCVCPLQDVTTRMHAQHSNAIAGYSAMSRLFKGNLQYKGLSGLYKGLVPNLLNIIPSGTAVSKLKTAILAWI